jgi:predicted CXXCH cytochrome family protein
MTSEKTATSPRDSRGKGNRQFRRLTVVFQTILVSVILSLLAFVQISAEVPTTQTPETYRRPATINLLESKPDSIPGTMPGDPPTATMADKVRRDFEAGCFESGCHARMRETRWLHGPVAAGACESCHLPDGPATEHKYKPTRIPQELCTTCHLPKEDRPIKHEPFQKFECVKCHSPHGGSSKAFISESSLALLCRTCHDGKEHDGKVVSLGPQKVDFPHDPTAKGDCGGCHFSHQAHHEKLLVRDKKLDLCLGCHRKIIPLALAADGQADGYTVPRPMPADTLVLSGDLLVPGFIPPPPPSDSLYYYVTGPVEEMERFEPAPIDTIGKQIVSLTYVHKPLTSDCSACHKSHGSNYKGMQRDEPRRLCLGCHKEFENRIQTAKSHHGAAFDTTACGKCHLDHASRYPHLLRESSRTICMSCHNRQIKTEMNAMLANIEGQISNARSVHEPINTGCVACHLNHGASERALLRGAYPAANYTAFTGKSYQLCLSCHKSEPFTQPGGAVSAFRNGSQNLHFLHVRGAKDRVCSNCHTPHGSTQMSLIDPRPEFGPKRVELPIGFEKTSTGGSCSSGCHRRLYYDRETVVESQSKTVKPYVESD